ncbi:MAG: hypothetical protein ACREML_11640 [Vulcanimicrobiaceae bacterium]
MLGSSLVAPNVLEFELDVIQLDSDAQTHPADSQTEIAAKVPHQASIRFQL